MATSMASEERTKLPAAILTADEWGGQTIYDEQPFKLPVEYVVLSLSTDTSPCFSQEECSQIVQEMQLRDMEDLGLYNIRYNFVLGGDGNIYQGRGWTCKPAITGAFSMIHGKYLHIACIGNYKEKVRPVIMYKAQWDLLQKGVEKKYLKTDFVFI